MSTDKGWGFIKRVADGRDHVGEVGRRAARERAAVNPRDGRRKPRTGQVHQINLKLTEETRDKFRALAKRMDVTMGEALEQMIEAWERSNA